MKIYFAPLEGIGGYIYRNALHRHFADPDKYFAPFISPQQAKNISPKEKRDICPEHNRGMQVVPQILTNRADQFLRVSHILQEYGYKEINLNLGCPSRTVVTKGKGAGFLGNLPELNHFFEEIYQDTDYRDGVMKLSVKTRSGVYKQEEFPELLRIFNQYPLEELILHPRVQTDFYKNRPNLEAVEYALSHNSFPICYNGDIKDFEEYRKLEERFSGVDRVMIGRGFLTNPGFVTTIRRHHMPDKQQIREFHDDLLRAYQEAMDGDKVVLFKMKEVWLYMSQLFTQPEKYAKKIKKAQSVRHYLQEVDRLFEQQEICELTAKKA